MREIHKLYLANFFQGLSAVASVTFTLYFLSHGLNQYQIGLLFSVFMIAMALFQIPTGGFADTYGQKESVFLGYFFHSLSFLIFAIFTNFYGFALGMLVSALGNAFITGAYSSLIINILRKLNKKDEFEKIIGRGYSFFEVAAIGASFVGPLIYQSYPRLTQVIAFAAVFLASVAAGLVKDEFVREKILTKVYFTKLKKGSLSAFRNKTLMALVLVGISLTVSRMVMNQNISQPYTLSLGIEIGNLGSVAALLSITYIVISSLAYRLSKKTNEIFSLLLMLFFPIISCFLLPTNYSVAIGVFLLITFYAGHTYRDVALSKIINDEVTDSERSTMVSASVFLSSIIVGISFPFWGRLVDLVGIRFSLYYLGLFTLVIGLLGTFYFTRNHKKSSHFEEYST